MPIYIYNSLTRKKEEFIPLEPPKVNIYTCGVTVYDESHIGHARSLYIFDVVRRYLGYKGYSVNFIRNITDIDDKIINRARELKIDWKELVAKYIKSYKEDLAILHIEHGILDGEDEPRATKNIGEIIKYIEVLINKGYAYKTATGVYFSVRKFKDYGKLSGQGIEQMLTGVRIEPDETKEDPLDFALWKISKEDEPYWESPWGRGRPGWHIECSVMSQKYTHAETLDIHAGGRDLIFPHHENEIAQSEAATGEQFAKYWLHHGLLTINGQKMAKSLGNFITIKDFVKNKDIDLLKLFFLSAHYSSPIDFTDERIEEARKQKKVFDDFVNKVNTWGLLKGTIKMPSSDEDKSGIDKICLKFDNAMEDDFNTPQALASLFELVDFASRFIDQDKEESFKYAKLKLENFFNILGLSVKQKKELPGPVKKKALEREQARKDKNFKKADELREEIKTKYKYLTGDTGSSATFTEI